MYKIVAAMVVVLTAGCTVTGPEPMRAFGIPNPASVYCIERGGTLDIKESPKGQVAMCVLPNGTRVEEWAFYRRNHPKN